MRREAQARNPYSRWWLWIPGSRFARPGMTMERFRLASIRLRQAQHLLGDEAENELRRDRGDARDQRFPQVTLDVIFLGVTEAAMGHHGLLAGAEAGFGGQILCGIGGGPAGHVLVVLPARAQHHQP